MIKNINTLAKINKHDSLYLENNIIIKKDKRYFKCYRPIYTQINDIVQIIKSTFNNELLLIHLSKVNNIDTEERLLRLQNAYKGILNLLFYYNTYTNYGNQITELIKYLDTQLSNIENINFNELSQTIQNSIEYEQTTEEYEEENNEEETDEAETDEAETDEAETDEEETDYSSDDSNEESNEDLNRSIYEDIKNSIYNSSNNIKIIIIQAVTSFINAVKSIFTFF